MAAEAAAVAAVTPRVGGGGDSRGESGGDARGGSGGSGRVAMETVVAAVAMATVAEAEVKWQWWPQEEAEV